MAKAFTKGQQVAVVSDWDRRGTVQIQRAVVHSCGEKVLRLENEKKGTFKIAFNGARANNIFLTIILDQSDAELEALALKNAEAIIASERARFARLMTFSEDAGYIRSVQESVADLHEPRVMWG